MKKRLGFVIGAVACIVGVYFYLTNGDGLRIGSKESPKTTQEVQGEIEKSYESETSNLVMVKYENMGENRLVQEVHVMTHQKVHAEQKWGSSEITADKVQKLYDVVMGKDFKNPEVQIMLLEILEPWTKGDFSNAVRAHNTIWSYQKGTIGEATRLLSAEEELEYIEDNFR
jgi:hypothetical protein